MAQLYLTHEDVEDAPLYALKGFTRTQLAAGASTRLHFTLTSDKLSLVDAKGNTVLTPGKIRISIGGSLPGTRSEQLGAAKAAVTEIEIMPK